METKKRILKHFEGDYLQLVNNLLMSHPTDRDLAFAKAVGSPSEESFRVIGDQHVSILRHIGLANGMAIYDLACGSGRTAFALERDGWLGRYIGVDVVPVFIEHLANRLTTKFFYVHSDYSIKASDSELDIIFGWSIFTHLYFEEILLYLRDSHRALRKNGLFAFSFIDLTSRLGKHVLLAREELLKGDKNPVHLDTFMSRDQVQVLALAANYEVIEWIDGDCESVTPQGAFGQSVVILRK